jgi:hypothetical protein
LTSIVIGNTNNLTVYGEQYGYMIIILLKK